MHADTTFYDELTPLYHLIHQDWNGSIERQGQQLSALIERESLDAATHPGAPPWIATLRSR